MDKKIKPIEYLIENYDEVSDFCNTHQEPMFFTKDGEVDLVAMRIEVYEKMCGGQNGISSL